MFVETWCCKQRDGCSIFTEEKSFFFDIMVGLNAIGGQEGKIAW